MRSADVQTNALVVVIEGDESINPDALRISTSADTEIVWAFTCRGMPGHSEPMASVANPEYTNRVYAQLKLGELIISVQTRASNKLTQFSEALDRPYPEFEAAAQILKALAMLTQEALQELIAHGRIAQEAAYEPQVGQGAPYSRPGARVPVPAG